MSDRGATSTSTRIRWWGFALFALVSAVHVGALVFGTDVIVYPTKLLLMPTLAAAVLWARPQRPGLAAVLLVGIGLSWFGDGAAFFFPFAADELPFMLLCFGLAHLAYIWLFLRLPRAHRVPAWTVVYAVWWVGMLLVLLPWLGALTIAVAAYGLVLGATATLSTRGGAIAAAGGAFFLASDTILALQLFTPDLLPDALTAPVVMLTYTIGQGLIACGVVRHLTPERSGS